MNNLKTHQHTPERIEAATQLIRIQGEASIALLQRHDKLGYSVAIDLMTSLEGSVVSTPNKEGRRSVLPFDGAIPNILETQRI